MVVIAPRHDGGGAALAALGRPERVDQGDHRGAYVKGARGTYPAEEGEVAERHQDKDRDVVEGYQEERQPGEGAIEANRLVAAASSEGGERRPRAKDGADDRHQEHDVDELVV